MTTMIIQIVQGYAYMYIYEICVYVAVRLEAL